MSKRLILLSGVILTGLVLRLACIGSGLPSKSLSLSTYHPDESIVLYSIAAMEPGKFNFHPGESMSWGSLYTYLTAAALKTASLAGYVKERERKFFEEDLKQADRLYLVGRAVSVLAGTLAILFMFLAGEALLGTAAGLIAAFLLAVSAGAVMSSVYLKPDSTLLLFCTLTLYLSVLIFKKKGGRACLLAGLAAGLTAASKYNGAVFVLVPLFAAVLARDRRLWQIPLFFCAGFVAGCPYSLIDPGFFLKVLSVMAKMGMQAPPPWNMGLHEGLSGYFGYYLLYALGWPLLSALALSLVWSAGRIFFNLKDRPGGEDLKTNLFLLAPAAVMYALFASSSRQVVLYGLPMWPLFFLLIAKAVLEACKAAEPYPAFRKTLLAAGCLAAAHVFVYSAAYAGLFAGANVREEASEWIQANIGKDKVIGLTQKYFWTLPALRKPGLGYKTVSFQDDSLDLSGGTLSLKDTAEKADYLVLSDFEIRDFLRLPGVYPAESSLLKEILGRKFTIAARFEKSPAFLGVVFNKSHPPWDWLYPNPTIYVYKKAKQAKGAV
ncbi:MAG: glycosyltransferase family 39 protein [Elusimicrobiota bacterium]|nr:glycosyltransferase family 39 protein [Elusimicrobiota bacterium]